MCAKLFILESPGKVKKIQEILGPDWNVAASVGHVRDLPDKEMGVAAPDFAPEYLPTDRGKKVLAKLAGLAQNAEEVYLATDPDREGEAIAWHLADALNLQGAKRVTYAEITESAVKAALAAPRAIDMALVAAQEGRRVLDRFCGYMVSGPLSNVAGAKLSAGRVQSPAVRLVVEREREIRAFRSTTHYGVELCFEHVDNITDGWKAAWLTKAWLPEGEEYVLDKALADKVAGLRTLDVLDCKESENRVAPPAPFTTSSLQQAASNALKFNPKRTMELAQKLYEGGYITYMRTDSPNLSEEAVEAFRAYCEAQGWPLVDKPRSWKSKKGAQEAHEAIRPTHIEVGEAGETADEKALYRLIRLRALAAQLADAVYAVRVLRLGGDVDGKQAFFEGKGRTLLDQGWKALMAADDTEDPAENAETDNPVPAMKAGTRATALSSKTLTKKTKPPARFTEASLVRELEKRGIGRPSTYAAILGTIMEPSKENLAGRGYVKEAEKRQLAPTPLGEAVVDGLHGHFAFADYEYTRNMEQSLDDIAEGKAEYRATVSAAFEQLTREVAAFKKAAGQVCPECGGLNLRRKVKQADKKDGRAWDFFACPDCANTFGNVGGKPGPKQEKREKTLSEFMCPECGKPLIRQQGQKKDGSGEYDFYGCSGYPKCGAFYPTKEDGTPDLNVFKCPECGKILKRRQGKKKDGSGEYDFYGCSGFPKCKATYQTKEDGTPDFERKQK